MIKMNNSLKVNKHIFSILKKIYINIKKDFMKIFALEKNNS